MADSTTDEPVVVFKKSKKSAAHRKRPATPPPDDSDSEYSSEDSTGGRIVKRRRTNGAVVTASSAADRNKPEQSFGTSTFAASRSVTIDKSDDATRQSNWYEEGRNGDSQTATTSSTSKEQTATPGLYTGASTYQSFIPKNPNAPQSKTKLGPVKGPTNVRTITVTDFAPDVCKDYKKTGFCGFGDSCKFLHAREDYKQGWQLDRDWEVDNKGKKKTNGTTVASANRNNKDGDPDDVDEAEEKLLEKIPFACVICQESYKNPIVTTCNHYFCESCALKRYRKTPNCAICGGGTGGVFNGAKNLKRLLDKKRERERRKVEKEQEKADGEDE